MKKSYTWRPARKDRRDIKYQATGPIASHSDLRGKFPPCYDQGNLGSCTANASGGMMEFLHPGFDPSRLFIYYGERAIEGTIGQDSGATVKDAVRTLAKWGVCPESVWPYDVAKFTQTPPRAAYGDALPMKISQYMSLYDLENVKACLSEGYPVMFGFTVYESFESDEVAATGIMPVPQPGEQAIGGHAVLAVGHDDSKQWLIVRNSWGPDWGDNGFFYMPYEVFQEDAEDYWTVRK